MDSIFYTVEYEFEGNYYIAFKTDDFDKAKEYCDKYKKYYSNLSIVENAEEFVFDSEIDMYYEQEIKGYGY